MYKRQLNDADADEDEDEAPCNGGHDDAERILSCIKQFSASEWLGCTSDGRYECHCSNDDGVNYCCGSQNQAEAIAIWEQCLGEGGSSTTTGTNCRSDICTDIGNDCCAPGGEARGCSIAGYEVQADWVGSSGWGDCVGTHGQESVYQCCGDFDVTCSLVINDHITGVYVCLLYTSPSPRDRLLSRMPSSA